MFSGLEVANEFARQAEGDSGRRSASCGRSNAVDIKQLPNIIILLRNGHYLDHDASDRWSVD